MSRRKGTPNGCCGDTCGNKVRKINGISPDPNGEFSISAGTGVEIIEDVNGITIDASRAAGVLTINGQSPDADGNFDGVITGQPGSIGTNLKPIKINALGRAVPVDNNLVDTVSGQIIQGEKVFDSNTYTTIGIRSSRVSGKLGGINFKDGSNNVISTFEVDVDGDVHFENKPNTGVMIDNQRAYDANNETDIVTVKTMKDNAVTIADNQTITGHKTIQNATLTVQSTNYPNIFVKDTDSYIGDNANSELGALVGRDKNDKRLAECRFYKGYDSIEWSQARLVAYDPNNLSDNSSLAVFNKGSSNKYSTTAYRTYNSSNVSDIVTIGSLASNPNVVHTTGNEEMSGTLKVKSMKLDTVTGAAGQTYCVLDNDNSTIDRRARLVLGVLANGNVELYLEKYILSTGVRVAQQTILTL